MRVHIVTYGCSNNQAESQIMAGLLKQSGFQLTNEDSADVIILNTCSVKDSTEKKILYKISSFHDDYPDKKLIVAGCLPEADIGIVRRHAKKASIVGTNHIKKIPIAVDLTLENNFIEFVGKNKEDKIGLPKVRENEVVNIIPISSGCSSFCTFCSTKLAKGNILSYNEEKIVEEIRRSKIGSGAKEFWLTSQDCGCYGIDRGNGDNIALLLNAITSSVPGMYFLRLGMANPQHIKRILPQLIDAYRDGHVFKFLHVPVQSGSEKILSAMRRGHTVQDFRSVVDAFHLAFQDITIWTDIIVGFPGETEEDFEQSMKLLKETGPDFVNISSYSPRPGTKAARMRQLPAEIKKDRTRRMSSLVKEICFEQNRRWLGWSGSIIIDEFIKEKGNFIGRNYAYKPVAVKGEYRLGEIVDVTIVDITATCLIGELLEMEEPRMPLLSVQ